MIAEAGHTSPARPMVMLRVPKRTGTLGDTLIAWGLALIVADVIQDDVILRNVPDAFEIEVDETEEQLLEEIQGYIAQPTVMLPWLECRATNRIPNEHIARIVEVVDRDKIREGFELLRKRGQVPDASGDAPATYAHPLSLKYRLFHALTNPGKQWGGYNGLVEQAWRFWTPAGVEALVSRFDANADQDQLDVGLDDTMTRLGINPKGDRHRNPPGFLFPGLNKGPTMRLSRTNIITGDGKAPDWMMVNRGDLSAVELYLAYVGYFNVATVHSYKGGRVVVAPSPDHAPVPGVMDSLNRARPQVFPNSPAAIVADAALAYGESALSYHSDFARHRPNDKIILSGAHVAIYWMPNSFTYAPQQTTFAPLPPWLLPMYKREGFDACDETLKRHRKQVQAAGRAESGEAREAITAYRESLSGGVRAWLRVMPIWHRAVLAEKFVGSWSVGEIERIAVALQPDLEEIIHDPAFENVTRAIRNATIYAYRERQDRNRAGQADSEAGDRASLPPGSPLSPNYDLAGSLQEAADRHPQEFLHELFKFVAAYNDDAARPGRRPRRRVFDEDLARVVKWIDSDKHRLVPVMLLAFGVSPVRRSKDEHDEDAPGEERSTDGNGEG